MRHVSMNQKGFSLVELMIVVGIIGILATLAVPKFQQFQAKAKMTEAKNMLAQIHSLEQSYFLDNNAFLAGAQAYTRGTPCAVPAWATTLGFGITPCNATTPRFDYTVASANAAVFVATATAGAAGATNMICPDDAAAPTFSMDQDRNLTGTNGNGTNPPTACGK